MQSSIFMVSIGRLRFYYDNEDEYENEISISCVLCGFLFVIVVVDDKIEVMSLSSIRVQKRNLPILCKTNSLDICNTKPLGFELWATLRYYHHRIILTRIVVFPYIIITVKMIYLEIVMPYHKFFTINNHIVTFQKKMNEINLLFPMNNYY